MPAAAVIPAPKAYIKVVAVKTSVVKFYAWHVRRFFIEPLSGPAIKLLVHSRGDFGRLLVP